MAKKHYPTVNEFQITQVTPATSVRKLIQVDRHLSRINRRLYRMGRYYKVKLDLEVTEGTTTYEVYALRDDWAVQKAFQMAYDQYLKNTNDERKALGTSVARWEDFRVEPGVSSLSDEQFPTLSDSNLSVVRLSSGTFDLANVVDSNDTRRTFTWGVPGASQYGLLQEYDKTANAQFSPASAPTGTAAYSDIDTEVNDLTHDDLLLDNREPPYDQNGVNASTPFVKIGDLGALAGAQKLSTGFFTAPCGIIWLVASTQAADTSKLRVTVANGDYKGVHAPSMLE